MSEKFVVLYLLKHTFLRYRYQEFEIFQLVLA